MIKNLVIEHMTETELLRLLAFNIKSEELYLIKILEKEGNGVTGEITLASGNKN